MHLLEIVHEESDDVIIQTNIPITKRHVPIYNIQRATAAVVIIYA